MRNAPQRGGLLEMVGWSAVFQAGLLIVVCLTQRLPVILIPEQLLISAMRLDMIHHRCFHVSTLNHALNTQWMGGEELLAGLLPGAAVPTAGRASRFFWVKGAVLIAVLPAGHQFRTAGMRTGALWSNRHCCHLVAVARLQTPTGILHCKTPLHSPDRLELWAYGTRNRERERGRGKRYPFVPIHGDYRISPTRFPGARCVHASCSLDLLSFTAAVQKCMRRNPSSKTSRASSKTSLAMSWARPDQFPL